MTRRTPCNPRITNPAILIPQAFHALQLVTGGTGTLRQLVVPRLPDAGCDVRVLSRRGHEGGQDVKCVTGDLATGEGIEAAVEGAEIIVHCA